MAKHSIGWRELSAAGFKVARGYRGKYYLATAPDGGACVMARQSKYKWHYFDNAAESTGSGQTPRAAMSGGLGDVIGTRGELRGYSALCLKAPAPLLRISAGLYRASSQVYNA